MRTLFALLASGCLLAAPPARAADAPDPLRRALADELGRTLERLVIPGEAKPYFVSYTVLDTDLYAAVASYGAVTLASAVPTRSIVVSLRVGSPELDNSAAGFSGSGRLSAFGGAPIEDDYAALRRELWQSSDGEYKEALEALAQKKNALAARVNERQDSFPDFSPEPKHETIVSDKASDPRSGDRKLQEIIERLSLLAARAPGVVDSGASAQRSVSRRRLLTSEGTWADEPDRFVRVAVHASARTEDGMHVHAGLDFTGTDPSTLPSVEVMEAKLKDGLARLELTRAAPLADGGSAVVLFEGEAAAELVRGLLARRLSGTPPLRYVGADTDRSLASKLGVEVVSPLLDVYDDPTVTTGPGGELLWGHFAADDEGVPAQRVSLIERGVLKTLLMSRAPRKEIRQSNGHFRRGRGAAIGNLIVKANRPLSRKALLELAVRESKKRGPGTRVYVVRRLAYRHAFGMKQSFDMLGNEGLPVEGSVAAMEASLVVDGKERPVRGLTLENIDLRALRDLLGAGKDAYVLNYGFASGTSVISPSLLIPNIDVKRHEADNPKPPTYPAP
ncbi:MAG TPA: metallopeptidase TldD-related protein [Polyangiaceae bacterium]